MKKAMIAFTSSNQLEHVDWDRNSDINKKIADMVSADINLDKAHIRCSYFAYEMVLAMFRADPNRRMKIQKFEKENMALKFALNKFGTKFLTSGLSLSIYLSSSEVTSTCRNAKAKIFGLFNRIGKYYDACLDDDDILSFLNNGDLGKNFESFVATHVTSNTMEEVQTEINNEYACRALERAQRLELEMSNKASSSLFALFRTTSPASTTHGLNSLRRIIQDESRHIEEINFDSEEISLNSEAVGFTTVPKCSSLQSPFSSEQIKSLIENNTSSRLEEVNSTRYKITLL
jgi:hypothetical protein